MADVIRDGFDAPVSSGEMSYGTSGISGFGNWHDPAASGRTWPDEFCPTVFATAHRSPVNLELALTCISLIHVRECAVSETNQLR
jgi:hypothetical protein